MTLGGVITFTFLSHMTLGGVITYMFPHMSYVFQLLFL
jgi:hypothetical protein